MGFFTDLLETIAPIAVGLIPGAAPVTAALTIAESITGRKAPLAIAGVAQPQRVIQAAFPTPTVTPLPALGGAAGALVGAAAGVIDTTGFGRGSGGRATRTIVQTMDLQTGRIIRTKTLPGSPFLMNFEIVAAKRVFRKSADLRKRIPRRSVKESATTQLKDAAIDAAIRAANASGGHHHHED